MTAKPSVMTVHVPSIFDAISDAIDDAFGVEAVYVDADGVETPVTVSFQAGSVPRQGPTMSGAPENALPYAVATCSILSVTQSRPGAALCVGGLRFMVKSIVPSGSRALLRLEGPVVCST